MTEQHYRVIADRDKGDDPQQSDIEEADRVTYGFIGRGFEHGLGAGGCGVRDERGRFV